MKCEYKGVVKKGEKILCDKCGADLTVDGSISFQAHLDGIKTYSYVYECVKCRNRIDVTLERRDTDPEEWTDDDYEVVIPEVNK